MPLFWSTLPLESIVVRRSAVSSQAYRQIFFQHLGHRGNARSELHVRLRVMNYADAEFLQQAELFGAYPNHVRGNYPIIQKADAIQIIYGRSTFRFDTVINLALGFRDVRHDGGAGAIGKCANCFQMIFRNCVGRVRRNRRNN